MRKGNVSCVFLFEILFYFFNCFLTSMLLCQSMPCLFTRLKTYNQIWAAWPTSQDIFSKVTASGVFDVIAFCSVILPSTVYIWSFVLPRKRCTTSSSWSSTSLLRSSSWRRPTIAVADMGTSAWMLISPPRLVLSRPLNYSLLSSRILTSPFCSDLGPGQLGLLPRQLRALHPRLQKALNPAMDSSRWI